MTLGSRLTISGIKTPFSLKLLFGDRTVDKKPKWPWPRDWEKVQVEENIARKRNFFFSGLKKLHNSGEIGDLSNLSKSIELICQCLTGCNNRNSPANKARSAQSAICNLCFSMIGFAITVIPVIRLFLNSGSKASQKRAFSRDVSLGCL